MSDNNASKTKITYLTAGAAGMYCGSCMHDNTLVRALNQVGYDATLLPTYTPIRTDEESVSVDQVFFGGINVFLQQKIPLFRHLPGFLDRFLDSPRLIRRATARSIEMKPQVLGKLAVSMLKGRHGNQGKEVKRLTDWLKNHHRPDLLLFTNLLIGGCIPYIKQQMPDVPILVTLQGDDVFLESLPESFKRECIECMKSIADQVDGFITHSQFYRNYMAEYLGIDSNKIHVTPLGLDTSDFERRETSNVASTTPRIGYLARLAPEKGFHIFVDAIIEFHKSYPDFDVEWQAAGWLGDDRKKYAEEQFKRIRDYGLDDRFQYLGSIDRQEKIDMLFDLDLFCVPTEFQEPKGLYALEALAAGVPVLAPEHGAFPELIHSTGGGILFPPNDAGALAKHFKALLDDREQREELSKVGRQSVLNSRNTISMAEETARLIERFVNSD